MKRNFQKTFGKAYESLEDELKAFRNFEKQYLFVEQHNKKFNAGETSFSQKLYEKSDISSNQKRKYLNGLAPIDDNILTARNFDYSAFDFQTGPSEWDWRDQGFVWTEV